MELFSRRKVIKGSLYTATTSMFLGLAACFNKKKPGEEAKPAAAEPLTQKTAKTETGSLISEESEVAKALGYKQDGTQADRPDKPGAKGEEQFCSACKFYKPVEGKEYGKCAIIPDAGKYVSENGWCSTWKRRT